MKTLAQLTAEGWVQQGRSFGLDRQFCVLVKENRVLVFNQQFDSFVMGEFEVPLQKNVDKVQKIDLSKQDYHNDNPV